MNTGRPTIKTPETIARIEEAFSLGGNALQACFHAGISSTTFYRWCEEDPDFKDRIEVLKQSPILRALVTINENLDDVSTAKWYLERKHPDFKPKQEVKNDGDFDGQYLKIIRRSMNLEEASEVYQQNLKDMGKQHN